MARIQEQNYKYVGRSKAFPPPEAAWLTFHLTELNSDTAANRGERKREKDKACMLVSDCVDKGEGGGLVQYSPKGVATRLKPWLLEIYTLAHCFNVSNI